MPTLTVDVNVIEAAASDSAHQGAHHDEAYSFLKRMKSGSKWCFSCDTGERIYRQYKYRLRKLETAGTAGPRFEFVKRWLATMYSAGRWQIVYPLKRPVAEKVENIIQEISLHREDHKYVRTAAGTDTKRLVSYNTNCYTAKAQQRLQTIPVFVKSPRNGLSR